MKIILKAKSAGTREVLNNEKRIFQKTRCKGAIGIAGFLKMH